MFYHQCMVTFMCGHVCVTGGEWGGGGNSEGAVDDLDETFFGTD